jgi:hypothetical protein
MTTKVMQIKVPHIISFGIGWMEMNGQDHALIAFPEERGSGEQVQVKVEVQSSLCLTKHHATKAYWGSGGIAPRILDLGNRWRLVVSFTPRPLYPLGKSNWYSLDRRLIWTRW